MANEISDLKRMLIEGVIIYIIKKKTGKMTKFWYFLRLYLVTTLFITETNKIKIKNRLKMVN